MASSIAAIHVAKKQLGLDDDTYRAKLARITGQTSTRDMTEQQRQTVLSVFRNEGFQPAAKPAGNSKRLTGKYAKKLQALWIAGYNLGIVRERDDAALEAFIKRQTGIDSERWLRFADDASKVIEALKGWIARETNVLWSNDGLHPQSYMRAFGYKIAVAQWSIICPSAVRDFWNVVTNLIGRDPLDRHLTDAEWIRVMNYFGEQIRKGALKAVAP